MAYDRYYHQFTIYLSCHAIPAVTNKNIDGCILRTREARELEGFDVLGKHGEVLHSVGIKKMQ